MPTSGDGWEGWLISHGRGPLPLPPHGEEHPADPDDAPESDEPDTTDD